MFEGSRSLLRYLYLLLSFALVGYVMYYAYFLPFERSRGAILYLALASALLFLKAAFDDVKLVKNRALNAALSLLLLLLSLAGGAYFFLEYYDILMYRVGGKGTLTDLVLGGLMIAGVLLLSWRYVERAISLLALAFMVYAVIGPYIPDGIPYLSRLLRHRGMEPDYVVLYLSSEIYNGIFGLLTEIAFTWISAFVIFASVLKALGGYDALFAIMRYLATRSPYLVPQTGVIGSALFGMYSGSAPANVTGTGVFTIPMNKRIGMPAKFAAAIEAVASSGGLIVPPVMGAAAFLMASLLGKSYFEIMLAAVLPAIVYYAVVSLVVFFLSTRYLDIAKAQRFLEETEKVRGAQVIRMSIPLFVAVAILIWVLAYLKIDPLPAAAYSTFAFILVAFFYNYLMLERGKPFLTYVTEFAGKLKEGVLEAAFLSATLGVMLATINIITGVLTGTGQSMKWSLMMTSALGHSLPLLVLAVWLIVVLLGFGVSTTGVYVIAVGVALTPFVKMGYVGDQLLIVHFFIFWVATLSAITPPVAIAAIAAAKIAQEKFFPVAVESVKIGLPLFLLPFAFFAWPEVLLHNSSTLTSFLILLLASLAMAASIYGPLPPGPLSLALRAVLFAMAALVMVGKAVLPPATVYAAVAFLSLATLYAVSLAFGNMKRVAVGAR
ncbi:MAG: TRAP transporter fused permease subunit [Acidilobaceae archaeon]|nr:TRAP transporter fused permease subunit [Acidilobaceae archaeon]MCX8166150.1 TRAP transporter fused permease subunit [Acidilobaceae archaeon]MDW7974788.1 TRAP transporter fused permease subunit [Sulfolobales archaeon]